MKPRPSTTQAILEVLSDRQRHTVTEIHRAVGPCRLNSRISELRKQVKPDGLTILCHHIAGESGPASYLYELVPLVEGDVSLPAASPSTSGAAKPDRPDHGVSLGGAAAHAQLSIFNAGSERSALARGAEGIAA